MNAILKNVVFPLGIVLVPIIIMYFCFRSVSVATADSHQAEYCRLRRKYILPASVALEQETDFNALQEMDNLYQEQLDNLQNTFGENFQEGEATVYCIEPDPHSLIKVTDYSAYASYLYQNLKQLRINPVYYCNTTLMKNTSREKYSEQKIMSFSNSDLQLQDNPDPKTAINQFLVQAFPIPETGDFREYIGFSEHEEGYPNGLYYFYCADFSGYNVNLYAMYFSFKDTGEFASVSYDNMILYGNDIVQFYDSSEKDLFATFGTKTDNINDKLSNSTIQLNTIIYNTHNHREGTLVIPCSKYLLGDTCVATLYSCTLSLR